jgi:hypothetical protein
MNTTRINAILSLDPASASIFRGTLASDEFASVYRRRKDALFVVNTDPSSKPGTHWIVVYARHGALHFFDPYGLPSTMFPTINRIIGADDPISVDAPLQGYGTDVCGDYCVLFALYVARGMTPRGFARLWMRIDSKRRDSLARNIVNTFTIEAYKS